MLLRFRKFCRRVWRRILRRQKLVEVPLDIDGALAELGPDLLAGIVRCSVSTNRLTSALDLLLSNARLYDEDEVAFNRNKGALVAWAALEIREAAKAVLDLHQHGPRKRLRWAHAEWKQLYETARRWTPKDSKFRSFREKFSAHRDLKAIKKTLLGMAGEQPSYLHMGGPKRGDSHYLGADEIAFRSWQENAGVTEFEGLAAIMDEDVMAFGKRFDSVLMDLFGFPNPRASE